MANASTADLVLPENVQRALVTGIMNGYKEYLDERNEKRDKMYISSAYAFTRSNHIDSAIHDALKEIPEIDTKTGVAGVAWEYLQAFRKTAGQRSLIITKGAWIANNNFSGKSKVDHQSKYLQQFAEINRADADALIGTTSGETMQLELPLSGASELDALITAEQNKAAERLNRFYITTYQLDANKVISSIKLTMPNPKTHNLFEVADLTPLIDQTGVNIADDDYETVRSSRFPEAEVESEEFNFEKPATKKAANDEDSEDK